MAMYYEVILFKRQAREIIHEVNQWFKEKEAPEYSDFEDCGITYANYIRRYGEYSADFVQFLSELKDKYKIYDLQLVTRYEDEEVYGISDIKSRSVL